MSDQGKIWFIYLTDHHEGPFSAAEVAEKAKQGLVNGQTLAWKDGMAEWIPAETIPELQAAFSGGGGAAAPEGTGEVSLAQLLASQQSGGGGGSASDISPSMGESAAPAMQEGRSALSSMVSSSMASSAPAETAVDASEPGPDEEVWTLKIQHTVNGLYSLNRLKDLAKDGEIPPDAMLWRSGWTDFQPVSTVPAVASSRRAQPAGATRTGMKPAFTGRPGGIAAITAAADIGNDDPTDPGIRAPGKFAFLDKLKALFKKKPKAAAAPMKTGAVMIGKKAKAGPGIMATIKKVVAVLLVVGVLGGGAAAYFLFFASPIPSDLDVLPEDKENLTLLVKEPVAQGKKFAIAQARGTEDNPADDTSPKFYVATNMPEGTKVTLTATGKTGTLVNKINFEKEYSATVAKTQLATFELKDDGKPLPMGEYTVKVAAEGAEPYEVGKFLGGKKGAVYDRRLKQYKEKIEKDYTEEVEEIRELVGTLKNVHGEVSKRIGHYKASVAAKANLDFSKNDWRSFQPTFESMASQLDAKLKVRIETPDQRYYPRAYQDISSTLGLIRQAAKAHGERLSGIAPSANPDELDGFAQAGIQSLEQVVAQAVIKNPYDVQKAGGNAPATPAAPATAAPAPQK